MMPQTSAEMNVNINPPGYMEIYIKHVTEKGKKLLNGWERWSLEDVNRTLDVLKEPGHRSAAQYVGQILKSLSRRLKKPCSRRLMREWLFWTKTPLRTL